MIEDDGSAGMEPTEHDGPEVDGPDVVGDFFEADEFAAEHVADVDPRGLPTDASVGGDPSDF